MRRKAGRIIIVTHWTYNNPVKIIFGAGSFDRINRLIDGRRYCIVTYGESYFSSLIDRLALSAGKPRMIVKDVAPNPDFALLIEQASRFSSLPYPPEVIIALGGGSVIDTAKVLASCGDDFERVKTFLILKTCEDSLLQIPIIAVPTTAEIGRASCRERV